MGSPAIARVELPAARAALRGLVPYERDFGRHGSESSQIRAQNPHNCHRGETAHANDDRFGLSSFFESSQDLSERESHDRAPCAFASNVKGLVTGATV